MFHSYKFYPGRLTIFPSEIWYNTGDVAVPLICNIGYLAAQRGSGNFISCCALLREGRGGPRGPAAEECYIDNQLGHLAPAGAVNDGFYVIACYLKHPIACLGPVGIND